MNTPRKRKISIMTVFLPRENIFFIEEWLKYHIAIGFNHFYLYNNIGSQYVNWGNSLKSNKMNKRGEKIYDLLADKTDLEVQEELDKILEPFDKKGHITQITWQPKDKNGNITYAQEKACIDYVNNYSMYSDWVGFIDMDEFIFPLANENINQFLDNIENKGYNFVRLGQKSFASRFTKSNKPVKDVLGICQCCSRLLHDFGTKAIVKANTLIPLKNNERFDIHAPNTYLDRRKVYYNPNIVRFNHYKFNEKELDWVRNFFKIDFGLNSIDKDILLYYDSLNAAGL